MRINDVTSSSQFDRSDLSISSPVSIINDNWHDKVIDMKKCSVNHEAHMHILKNYIKINER